MDGMDLADRDLLHGHRRAADHFHGARDPLPRNTTHRTARKLRAHTRAGARLSTSGRRVAHSQMKRRTAAFHQRPTRGSRRGRCPLSYPGLLVAAGDSARRQPPPPAWRDLWYVSTQGEHQLSSKERDSKRSSQRRSQSSLSPPSSPSSSE